MKLTIHLWSAQQAVTALRSLYEQIKPHLIAGKRLRVLVEEERRSLRQNDYIHPTVRAIAKAAGRPTDDESLRVLRYLLLEQWRAETKRPPQFERSLDGMRLVDVSKGTSDLDKPDCSEFIQWMEAFAAQFGVESPNVRGNARLTAAQEDADATG